MVNSLMRDKLTSMTAAQAISAALFARERNGIGQRIDIAMLEAALFFTWPDNMLNHTFVGDDVPFSPPLMHTNFVRKTADIMPALEENQVPFAKINARDEVVTDPQVIAMEALIEFEHPFAGPMRQARPRTVQRNAC